MQRTIVIQSSHDLVHQLCKNILDEVKDSHFSTNDIFGIHLALEEAMMNAVKHGNKQDPLKKIQVEYSITPEKFDISIIDEGGGFAPTEVPDPRCGENLFKATGRGLLLMKAYMDYVEYNESGNRVHMMKYKEEIKNKKCK
ncbi:MAG TPA: ATP-binding protein [Methylococcales bacterium]